MVEELKAPHQIICDEEKRIINEWTRRLEEAKEAVKKLEGKADLYKDLRNSYNGGDGCTKTVFRENQGKLFDTKAEKIEDEIEVAEFKVARIEKYLNYLKTLTGDDCQIA